MMKTKHGKKKSIVSKILPAVFCVLFALVLLLIVSSSEKVFLRDRDATVELFGSKFPASSEALVFSGDEVSGVDEIVEKIGSFSRLGFIDLGTFSVNVNDVDKIGKECPGVKMSYRTHVSMYGKDFDTQSTEVDLNGVGMTDVAELTACLPYLPAASKVTSEDAAVPLEEKQYLEEQYPDIEFDVTAVVDVFGVEAKDNAEELDLKGCVPDGSLVEKLRLFPNVRSVDLHDVQIGREGQLELIDAFPDVRFHWDVELGGEKYDSATEDLDLSNRRGVTLDALREAIPLFCDLKRVDLSGCGFSNETLADFRKEFTDTKIVWRLYLGRWSLMTDAVAFSVLIYTYDYKRLTSADIEVLKYCTDLQALDLGHQALTDLSVIGDYLPELRILILADNTVSDLTPIAKLKHLHYLELFVNPYLSDLSPIEACKEMVDLNISHLYTVSDISKLLDFPILERLWIEHTAVSAADIQLLKNTYPNATVIDQGYGSVDRGWRAHDRYFAMIDMYHQTNYISEEFSKYDSKD